MKPKFAFLMSAVASDVASGGAGSVSGSGNGSEGQKVEGQKAGDGGDGGDAPKELSFVEKVAASFQSKGVLAAELQSAKERATRAEAEVVTLTQKLEAVTAERDGLAGEKQEISNLLLKAQENAKTVTQEAVETVAALGFNAVETKALPGSQEQTESPIKQLEKDYAATSCPKEKGKIAKEMQKLMAEEA